MRLFSKEVYYDDGVTKERNVISERSILDSYSGRSSASNGYYYLSEPVYFTGYDYKKLEDSNNEFSIQTFSDTSSRESLIGFAKDGFPIYGPHEYSTQSKPTDLDECGGHFSNTGNSSVSEFGEIYHYHVKAHEDITSSHGALIGCYSGVSP